MFLFKRRDKGGKEYKRGREYLDQQKYAEAEQLLRQSAQQREKVLGAEHEDTLDSKQWLALALNEQQKYAEEEQLWRASAQQLEKVLGAEDENTLWSKYCLALTLHEQQKYAEAEQVLRQSAQQREKVLGEYRVDTLESKYQLGLALYEQQKYAEAEQVLRQSAQQRERVLGAEHVDTLKSKDCLAVTLQNQQKYAEAEQLLRQSAQQREKVLGAEDVDTLDSKYRLAVMLHMQRKYAEAEQLLQQSVQQREKVLGAEHEDTLDSKYWLALTLHEQQKYAEAEALLRMVVQQQEKVLGAEHEDTLHNKASLAALLLEQEKHAEAEQMLLLLAEQCGKALGTESDTTLLTKCSLGWALRGLQRYGEAERLLRQMVEQTERALGAENVYTLESKYSLGVTLCDQQKYAEAEQLLRHVDWQREKSLGADDKATLENRHYLALTLHRQHKHTEAELLLQQVAKQQEKVLGADHKHTLASKELLQKVLGADRKHTLASKELLHKVVLAKAPPASTETLTEAASHQLGDFFAEGNQRQKAYSDSDIRQVCLLLSQVNLQWSKVPRTYIVLRSISCLELLNTFIDLGVSDLWFPFTEQTLPPCVLPSKRSQFVAAQNLVMTKSVDLEKGEKGQHCYFRANEPLPLEMKGRLGSGGFGQVDQVLSTISFREYALKRVLRSAVFSGAHDSRRKIECIRQFAAEMKVLKRVRHRHVVEFVGSYTDPKYMGLLMSPVADMDLSAYLDRTDSAAHQELRTFFGCLTRALEFLHEQHIRHKDIKPSNILVHRGNVLYTDFGLAFDFTDKDGSTTVSMVNGMTPRYCAPEVADHEPRNTSSDIWSLGVVFLEMTVVLKGRKVRDMYNFLQEHGSGQSCVRTNLAGANALIAELKATGDGTNNAALGWVRDMVRAQQQLRPTAASLIGSILSARAGEEWSGNKVFCGICCASPDDDHDDMLSDFDELEISRY